MKNTRKFACNKKCFGVSDRFIGSKDSSASLLHCSISNISLSLSSTWFAVLALKCAGLLTFTSRRRPQQRLDLTCGELARRVFLCGTLSDSVGPSGKRLQLRSVGGWDGAGEREKAERRGDALRSVSGFMELCITDPPPWIATRDHSFWFYTFSCAAPLPSPSSTPPTKVSELSLHGHVFTHAHARVLCVSARTLANGAHQRWLLSALSKFFNDAPMWSPRSGQQSWERTQTRETWSPTAELPSAPDNSCLKEDEWAEEWRDRSRSAHRRVNGGRVEHRRQLWCLVRLEMSLLNYSIPNWFGKKPQFPNSHI